MISVNGDMLRGNLDTAVLRALIDGRKYGNQIIKFLTQRTQGLFKPNEQSLYSAFHRLEDQGLIVGQWGQETVGAQRKYYTITEEGRKYYLALVSQWNTAKQLIDLLIS